MLFDTVHVEQFAKTFNNHPTNGIALCPNLHRAFDRGAISIDDNYEIILSKSIKENMESEYSFHKLEGKKILLPQSPQFYPSLESLAGHRKIPLKDNSMLKWNDNIAIGKDKKNSFTFYDVQENGDLWLSGDKWGKKYYKKRNHNIPKQNL